MMIFRKLGPTEGEISRLEAKIRSLEINVQVLEEQLRAAYRLKPVYES